MSKLYKLFIFYTYKFTVWILLTSRTVVQKNDGYHINHRLIWNAFKFFIVFVYSYVSFIETFKNEWANIDNDFGGYPLVLSSLIHDVKNAEFDYQTGSVK